MHRAEAGPFAMDEAADEVAVLVRGVFGEGGGVSSCEPRPGE